jgi:hypothetical protein
MYSTGISTQFEEVFRFASVAVIQADADKSDKNRRASAFKRLIDR